MESLAVTVYIFILRENFLARESWDKKLQSKSGSLYSSWNDNTLLSEIHFLKENDHSVSALCVQWEDVFGI